MPAHEVPHLQADSNAEEHSSVVDEESSSITPCDPEPVKSTVMVSTSVATDDIEARARYIHDHPYCRKWSLLDMTDPKADCKESASHHPVDKELQPELFDIEEDTSPVADPDYVQDEDVTDSESSDDDDNETPLTSSNHDMFVVFWENLLPLFKVCHVSGCCSTLVKEPVVHVCGFAVTITTECLSGHTYKWNSQPKFGTVFAGNLLVPSALFLTGNSYQSFTEAAKCIKLATLSTRQCNNIQRAYAVPEVENMWAKHTESIRAVLAGDPLLLSGDARCDSPGHNATFGTYTLMDTTSHLILAQETVRVTDDNIPNSYWLEPVGLELCIKELDQYNCNIKTIATDRHPSVQKIMRGSYPHITHEYDLWHIVKGVKKKLLVNKDKDLAQWVRAISNHLWYCAASCEGNQDILKEKWIGLLHHITDEHEWVSGDSVNKCDHAPYSEEERRKRPWLSSESNAFEVLKKVVLDKRLLKDLEKVTACIHTGELESVHSLYTKYVPKRKKFSRSGMQARLRLAALDHNLAVGRVQAKTVRGILRFKHEYSKSAGNYIVKPIKVSKDWSFRDQLIAGISDRCSRGPPQRELLEIHRNEVDKSLGENAGVTKVPKSKAVNVHVTRMARNTAELPSTSNK